MASYNPTNGKCSGDCDCRPGELCKAYANFRANGSRSTTPRTDALVCVHGRDNIATPARALIDLCRELENELAEAKMARTQRTGQLP